MFNREKREAGNAALRAEVDRLAALGLADLGTEVMTRVFGPGGPGADGAALTIVVAANAFISEEASWCDEDATREELVRLVGEGLQIIEHACLAVSSVLLIGTEHWGLGWAITRLGTTSLAQDGVERAITGSVSA